MLPAGSLAAPLPGYLPATSWVHYTTSCKQSLVLLKMGEIIARNMLSWLELLINRYFCISLVAHLFVSRHISFLRDFCYCSIYVCISYVIVSLQMFRKKVTQYVTVQWAKPLLPIKEVLGLNCQPETDYPDRKFRCSRIQSNLLGQTAALNLCSYSSP